MSPLGGYLTLAMPIRPPEYDAAALWLEPILKNLPPKLIAITGPLAAGKTTLARFLAWYFNISLIETDHYLIPHKGLQCESNEIDRIIEFRLSMPRPVIVEGAEILPLLSQLNRVPDGIIHVRNKSENPRATTAKARNRNPSAWGFSACPIQEVAVTH
jgi:hypothetical protein